ncbi:MAG: transporter substrate-binding domain-containing protein [Gudongella sp.]|nr:transporter substrate-binding domain-containing protein [Gudongella sp.]
MRKYQLILLFSLMICFTLSTPSDAKDSSIDFTEEEILFMDQHPEITVGVDPLFVPFEFIDDNNNYNGIAADYLLLIGEKTGLSFKVVEGLTWPETYDLAMSGQIDLLPAVSRTIEREHHFLFTESYYRFKRVIVTRDDETEISGIEDLTGLSVAVQRNSSHHSYLISKPGINLSLYNSVEDALTAVANDTERVFVGNIATTNYIIRNTGLTGLRFTAFDTEDEQGLHMAIREDWPQLVSILNKSIESIDEEERMAIYNKWIGLEGGIDYARIARMALLIGLIVATVLGVSFYWNFRLKREVEERRKVQSDLEEAKKVAEEANEFKSGFLARMSHEIRTPLNAITGMSYLLGKTGLTLTQEMYTDRISQASANVLSIVNDILDYSKIEAGRIELEEVSFSMDKVIQDVVNIVSYKIEDQGIGFRLSKDPRLPNWYYGDPKRIEQVLLNLLNNAAKFTSNGEVALEMKMIAREDEIYHVAFTISDTGIGMTKEQVDNLFNPFVQADSTINRRFGGSGLGLSIVKNLVEMMGGKIQVYSSPGQGSTFVVDMSLKVDMESEKGYLKAISGKQFRDIKTLILEKSGANMNLIDSYLSAFGMHCELTSSPSSAVRMLEEPDGKFSKAYDLLILDYDTPEDPLDFVRSLRANDRISKMPKVMILLPMMREDLMDSIKEEGIDIGIGKPIIPSILLNGILEIFRLKPITEAKSYEEGLGKDAGKWGNKSVLIVEDNKTNQMIASTLLKQAGIDTIIASDGREGFEKFKLNKDKISMILMDLHMPVMNGYESSEEIRKISKDVPIIAMTADVVLGVKDKCTSVGIDDYISKPFDPEMFLQKVGMILDYGIVTDEDESSRNVDSKDEMLVDKVKGLRNMGGNKELYLQVLRQYKDENLDTPGQISQLVSLERYKEAANLVHKLKSSSGSIGADSLYEISIRFQRALEKGHMESIEGLHVEFKGVLVGTLEEIR